MSTVDELKRLSRRIDEVASSVEIVRKDRDMFEDILLRLENLERALNLNKEHQAKVSEDIKADIKKVEFAVEDKAENLEKKIDQKEILIIKHDRFERIKKFLKMK